MSNTHSSKHKIPEGYEHLLTERTLALLDESGVVLEVDLQHEASSAYPLYIAAYEDLFPLSGGDMKLDQEWQDNVTRTKNFFTTINNWVKKNDPRCKLGKIHSWLIVRENEDLTGDFLFTDSKSLDADIINKGVVVGFAYGDNATITEMVGSVNKMSSEAVLESALKNISLFYNNQAMQVSFRHNGFILDALRDIPKSSTHSAILEDRINKAIMAITLKKR